MSAVIPDPATTDWVPLGGIGIQGGLIPIAEVILGAAAATIDFQNIPQIYRDLRLVVVARGAAAAAQAVMLRFNGDSGANYDRSFLQTAGSGQTVTESLAVTELRLALVPGSDSPAGFVGHGVYEIPWYAGTAWQKTVTAVGSTKTANATSGILGHYGAGAWRSTAAITSINLLLAGGNFAAGSRATLYGIAAPGVTYLPQAQELARVAITTTAAFGSPAPGATICDLPAISFDGNTDCDVELWFPHGAGTGSAVQPYIYLYDSFNGGAYTQLGVGWAAYLQANTIVQLGGIYARWPRLRPAAGSHAFRWTGLGTGFTLSGGVGTGGAFVPGEAKVIRR